MNPNGTSASSVSQSKDYDYMFKLILLGSSGVGKSNILLRYTRNIFNESFQTTIGVQYATKTVQTNNKKKIKFQIWDTAGQQQYKSIMKTFYKGTSAVLLTYDIADKKSFSDLQFWFKQIKQYCKSEVVIMLVGNKADLEDQRLVSKQDGLTFAENNRIAFYQVSAKTGVNVDLIFGKIAQQLQKIMEQVQIKKKESIATRSIIQKKQSVDKEQNLRLKKKDAQKKQQKQSCCGGKKQK